MFRPLVAATIDERQVEYMDWVAAQVGEPPMEARRREIYEKALRCIWSLDDSYRDSWEEEEEEENR
jgi:hypothetical protein